MSRLKEAIEFVSNRFVGLDEPSAQKALETIYEAAENGEIRQRPCQGEVECSNGQKATIHFPNSHSLPTRRGVVKILRFGHGEEKISQ